MELSVRRMKAQIEPRDGKAIREPGAVLMRAWHAGHAENEVFTFASHDQLFRVRADDDERLARDRRA